MSLSTKILIWVGAVLVIGILGFIVFKQVENSNRQIAIQTELVAQKQLIDGVVRSSAQWTTKDDMDKFIKDSGVNLKAIQDDLNSLNAQITAANNVVVTSVGQKTGNLPSTGTGPSNPNPTVDPKNPDPFGYSAKEQDLALNEDFGTLKAPIGTVGFSAWQKTPWNIDIKPREYHVVSVIGTDENQRMYVENKFTLKVDNKNYDIPIKSAATEQIYPTAKFSWWNPRLFLTVGGGVNLTKAPIQGSANAGLTVGIMSYGQYKTTPAISILQLGVVYETGTQRPAVVINPVNFNIGGILPKGLVDNTYLGPSLQMDTAGNVIAGANVSVGF